uniref:Uncharacterized protein n=1 Tax=Podoviridae sp. ct7gc4 TaxID=2826542 RepID=A0A8S5NKY9_9CAUD|nr:MAG TPA: hypothetical protein [Podoviridae sp. ct7gc4]
MKCMKSPIKSMRLKWLYITMEPGTCPCQVMLRSY